MIEAVVGDITGLAVDCVVNAANSSLMGGAGVDGAIHRGAGPRLLDECRRIGGCPTGDARMTGVYDLAARHVVHAVGPVWKGGMEGEDELLASRCRRSFELAEAAWARSIAFPAISTGAYGFPKERAAAIAVREMTAREDRFERIIACCFSEADAAFYRRLLPAAHPRPAPGSGRPPGVVTNLEGRQRKRDRRDPTARDPGRTEIKAGSDERRG